MHRGQFSQRAMRGLALVLAMAAAVLLLRQRSRASLTERRTSGDESHEEDCRTEECGPDGTPLSLYAG